MRSLCFTVLIACTSAAIAAEPTITLNVWPGRPPEDSQELPPEADQTKPEDKLIAGRPIIKLGNVSTPQIAVYRPAKHIDTGTSVVICPGGGHHILAYDLEGTEVAEWLNTLGISGIVLKYRVPFRDPNQRSRAAVQDGQRAVSLVRSKASEWALNPKQIGMLGFSAGGEVTALVSLAGNRRQYDAGDNVDRVSCRPDFSALIYPGGLVEKGKTTLRDHVAVSSEAPPAFMVHAFDDDVSALNTLLLAAEYKKAGVSTEVHLFAKGGHGYGLRRVDGQPVTEWPKVCEAWLKAMQLIP